MSKSGAPHTNFTTGTKRGRWWNFPFAAQQSTPLQVQNAVPAHDRGFLLNDSRVARFQGPLGQSAWASNGYFLAAQDPVVTFSQSRPEKEGPAEEVSLSATAAQ